jgi:peptide/nickel transport system permease protein
MLTRPELPMQPPTLEHPFGTDGLGRDILARVLHGGQRTLAVASLATLTAVVPGTVLGIVAGWSRGWLDRLTLTIMNAMIAFPGLLLALVIVTLIGRGFLSIGLAVGLSQAIPFALLVRSTVRELQATLYVEAAHAAGATHWRITLHHAPTPPRHWALRRVVFAYAILNGAALGFWVGPW